ncbi:hypothetical protein QWM81_26895 [Streptomyces ficellus]|uniref:Uncharacterized protein n=1 Tax=Streptomyces ficellus TaxID=1977088 RepID=A0ABT7ZDK5_9ACTN|nr:hypothetical protein [Streptomyces ficellus]MDN3297600.1 hypothetical protein [Streptomyces ficellus]
MCADSTVNNRTLDLPGDKPDTAIFADVCVGVVNGNQVQARTTLYWHLLADQVVDRSKRFSSVRVTTRAEKRSTNGTDSIVTSKTCDFTDQLNQAWANSTALTCQSPATAFGSTGSWSADATVIYDIEGDGKGAITWQLTGSPLIP